MNFAPAVDVNNNPANPVIGVRSFGDNPEAVAGSGVEFMKGLHAAGIIAAAKHFP
jgi:beta-N-acetylhexosaminidase